VRHLSKTISRITSAPFTTNLPAGRRINTLRGCADLKGFPEASTYNLRHKTPMEKKTTQPPRITRNLSRTTKNIPAAAGACRNFCLRELAMAASDNDEGKYRFLCSGSMSTREAYRRPISSCVRPGRLLSLRPNSSPVDIVDRGKTRNKIILTIAWRWLRRLQLRIFPDLLTHWMMIRLPGFNWFGTCMVRFLNDYTETNPGTILPNETKR
jgi:hypothetical protein